MTAPESRRRRVKQDAVDRVVERIEKLSPGSISGSNTRRRYLDALRSALRLYEDATPRRRGLPDEELRALADRAFRELGGAADLAGRSLKDYDHVRFGPYLGVSGEADAAAAICDAALASPKVVALRLTDPLEVGVAHDAERLGSIGELPVGPDEYRAIRLHGVGRILTSTNIGARVNVRYYGTVDLTWVNRATIEVMVSTTKDALKRRLAPFVGAPDGRPRATTAFVRFREEVLDADRNAVLKVLFEDFQSGAIGSPPHHRLGLVAGVRRGAPGVAEAIQAMDLATRTGVSTVALDGVVRAASDRLVSAPGLLQYFNAPEVRHLLSESSRRGIDLVPVNQVDTESVARHVWAGLIAARHMGLELGKYGLFPLTFDESERVIGAIQAWFPDWTATPAFYVDQPSISGTTVFERRDVASATKEWLSMVARLGVRVVLIDTVEKSRGLRLLKTARNDRAGILDADTLAELDQIAVQLGVRVLWAGGISLAQAFELGRMGVFGLYVTSAVAGTRPVGPPHEFDPGLPAERVPTREGVARVKTLVEAGFLASKLRSGGEIGRADRLQSGAEAFLREPRIGPQAELESHLAAETRAAWRRYAASISSSRSRVHSDPHSNGTHAGSHERDRFPRASTPLPGEGKR